MSMEVHLSSLIDEELWGHTVNDLWAYGNIALLRLPMVSVVGTRNLSGAGESRTRKLTTLLVQAGCCIVSGLAAGVDTVAHETALALEGKTVAVMGTPLDECYPKENRLLKKKIEENGLVLSQFKAGSRFHRGNFPRRNATMAALSAVTFVVEAQIDSGTRHQVKAAISLGKKVAFLSSLVDLNFPWVNDAIHSGHGVSIQEPNDALELLVGLGVVKASKTHLAGADSFQRCKHMSEDQPILLDALPKV